MSQTNFAEGCGVKKNAQIKYEKNERNPDSAYLEKAHSIGVDVSYLVTGIRTPPVELPSDEALLLDSYRDLDADQKKTALRFWLGGMESIKELATPNIENKNNDDNTGVIAGITRDVSIDNSTDSSTDNSNQQGVFNSPNSPINNSFNTESGFTELPFIYACAFCGSMAWLLGALASWKAATDMAVSLSFGQVGLVLWAMTIVLAVFGYYAGKKKYDEVQAELGSHA
ncbi:helix-turn-helix transcriptional regulator [Psychrobacter sp. APC 3279]|uniref:helix-turn-helix domain-containing protein n=1 Tax=Psychrobacter sp. APC 3279 TaxID=3035189 RepID=UPI0025B4AC0E|nr:helix-turn-helix transcriptional regulator [Psychrobacter sp. APC 3279]MDN3441076.1 helix-turn-helix transcriptional regulator [Psychrobacter sp. APC 3279]